VSWLLKAVSVEGFRGVNNEGAPLHLQFKTNRVNSVAAPNGVGKSSIFDAVMYALTGRIQKLEDLPAAEQGQSYYLNRFHPANVGTVALTLEPDTGGNDVEITVTRDSHGNRNVAASGGADGDAILAELNREFVLLDGPTFHEFINFAPLARGRSFAGLLGLKRYSAVRQALQSLANTNAFNNHFGIRDKNRERATALQSSQRALAGIRDAYKSLTGEDFDPSLSEDQILKKAFNALDGIGILQPHCAGKPFLEISIDDCVAEAKKAEGGETREKHSAVIKQEGSWIDAMRMLPTANDGAQLIALAKARDDALAHTQGDLFLRLYKLSEEILTRDDWTDKSVCPTCDRDGEDSVLEHVQEKVAKYNEVAEAAASLSGSWADHGWNQLGNLEKLALAEGEVALLPQGEAKIKSGGFDEEFARKFTAWIATLAERGRKALEDLRHEKEQLEQGLPPLLTAVVEKAEAARRLQMHWLENRRANSERQAAEEELHNLSRIKRFLDNASGQFADAESRASARRLEAVKPVCRQIFGAIVFEPIVPSLSKREGSEDLSIGLAQFWNLNEISARAVLSESYRNAFAISVYLAAASLYGGSARFLILDDVTSSFDAGHQFHLMEVIRKSFARPGKATGPQVIILSHDTMLEKLFNKYSRDDDWWHQRIEGNARTSVLPQSGAVNKVRDTAMDLLNVGRVEDASPWIRRYLEYRLEEVIHKLKIPVPLDIAHSDYKQMPQNLIEAIDSAVGLHVAANSIVLEPLQIQNIKTEVAAITGNYLNHWATGQVQAFAAGPLMGVMQSIDNFSNCFKYQDPPGSGNSKFYRSLSQR